MGESLPNGHKIKVHDEKELERVSKLIQLEDHLVGINNRNLETFEVDLDTTAHLLSSPVGKQVVCSVPNSLLT